MCDWKKGILMRFAFFRKIQYLKLKYAIFKKRQALLFDCNEN